MFLQGLRLSKQVPLSEVAAEGLRRIALTDRFDARRDHVDPELMARGSKSADDRLFRL